MAAVADDSPSDRLQVELMGAVDLRLLSQSELYALSLCSDGAFDPRRCDDVVIPKIDRSVFNESAGSRKQTYSRLRLAPRKLETTSASAATSILRRNPHLPSPKSVADENDHERAENGRIVSLMKELFAAETNGEELIPVRVEYSESMPELTSLGNGVGMKRKRGRPRKNENAVAAAVAVAVAVPVEVEAAGDGAGVMRDIVVYENIGDRDREIVNKNGVVLDVAALANLEDPYGPQLRRMTEGLETVEELLGFLGRLNGQWGSRRRKKKIVDASDFGDALPKGWKLLLSPKKKEGRVWLYCRRYISPNGRQFVSCKEVSSYLLSFARVQDSNQSDSGHCDENIQLTCNMASGNVTNLAPKEDNKIEDLVCYSPSKVGNPGEARSDTLKCHKCTMSFNEKDDLLNHQSTCQGILRSESHTSITNEVIVKDGKFECQFSHKTFTGRSHYNGHVGIHVSGVEGSAGVLSMQNNIDPISLDGVTPRGSTMQTSIREDSAGAVETSNAKADNELSSDFPHTKANDDVETHAKNLSHELSSLSSDNQDMKANRNEKILAEECWDEDRDYKMAENCLGGIDKATAVTHNFNFCLPSDTVVSNKEKDGNSETFSRTDVLDCATNRHFVGQERILESSSPSFTNKQARGLEINMNKISAGIEESNQDRGSEIGLGTPNGIEEMRSTENVEVRQLYNTMEADNLYKEKFANKEPISCFHGSFAGQGEDIVNKFKQQNNSDVCSPLVPIRSWEKSDDADNIKSVLTSVVAESRQTRDSESNVPAPSGDKETCGDKDNGLSIGFGGSCAARDQLAGAPVQQEQFSGSCSFIPQKDLCALEDNDTGSSTCMPVETWHQGCKSSLLVPSHKQTCTIENNADYVSWRKIKEAKFDEVPTSRNGKLVSSSSHSGLNEDVLTSTEQDRILEYRSFIPSGNQPTFVFRDKVNGVNSGTLEEPKHVNGLPTQSCVGQLRDDIYFLSKVSSSSMEEPKLDKVQTSRNTELILAFGDNRIGVDANAVTGVGTEQTCCIETNSSKVNNSTVAESQQEGGSASGFLGPSCYVKTFGSEHNLNRVYPGKFWEGPRIEEVGNFGNKNFMTGFGSSNVQPDEGVMLGDIWRTDKENVLQSGLAANSATQVQSSSCYPTFNLISDKDENQLFKVDEKYDTISGFEGLRSGSVGHVEFNFLDSQNFNSLQEDSKALAYDTELGQGFNSSFWLEKDALSPHIATRSQVTTVCVWCRTEFRHEPVHPGIQAGAIGSVCPACNAKFSEQFNVL